MSMPTITAILPSCNRLEFLSVAVESVFAQTYPSVELIVADDGSDAPTRDWLRTHTRGHRVLWLAPRRNPGAARNAALHEARGEYVAFIDSDDVWLPDKLATQFAAMRAAARRWSYCAIERIDTDGMRLRGDEMREWVPHEGDIFEPLLRQVVGIALPTVIAERSLIQEAGGFDESLRVHEDQDLWLRLALRADVAAAREPLVRVRCHDQHYSLGGAESIQGWDDVLAKYERLLADPRRRAQLRRARAYAAVRLARFSAHRGDGAAVLRALGGSSARGWQHLGWWRGAALALARLALPKIMTRPVRLP